MISNGVDPIYGDVPETWQLVSLGSLMDSQEAELLTGPFGTMLHASSYRLTGTPVVAVQHIGENRLKHVDLPRIDDETVNRLQRYKLKKGDILFGRKGSVERRAIIQEQEEGWLEGSDCIRLRFLSESISPNFISYVLGSTAFKDWIMRHAGGATMPSLNQTILRLLPLPLPPLPEQQAIARILGALDDKIALNRRTNHTLEEMARALFKSWFLDFDPIIAKTEGRVPFGMNAEIASLFPIEFEGTEEGSIPKGWKYVSIGEVMTNFDSRRVPLSGAQRLQRQGIYPYYGAASIMDYIDDYLFDGIYLLVGEDGSVEDRDGMAVTQYGWGKFWVNNHAHVLQGKNNISTEHIYLHYKFEPISPYVTGAVQPKINQGNLNSMPFLLPSKEVSEAFTKMINPWFAAIRANHDEIKTLSSIRDALLPKLLSGELRVKDVAVGESE